MEESLRRTLWRQCGAAIDMLENAITACPEPLWSDPGQRPEFWYTAFHTLFFLDLYSSASVEGFAPPWPFTRDEMDPRGIRPERVYTRTELLAYLEHGRAKCRAAIAGLTAEQAARRRAFPWGEVNGLELFLYNLRHVQHHTAQLNLILRQKTASAPCWVAAAVAQ